MFDFRQTNQYRSIFDKQLINFLQKVAGDRFSTKNILMNDFRQKELSEVESLA